MGISITGLTSGLDTAQIVSDLMAVEKLPYTRLETKKTNLQSEQNIFRMVNTKLSALETAANELRYSYNFDLFKATSSNTAVLKAKASSNAATGTYNLEVEQLAKGATAIVNKVDGSSNSWAQQLFAGNVNLYVDGQEIDLAAAANGTSLDANSSNEDVMKALTSYINSNPDLKLKATLVKTNDSLGNPEYSMSLSTTDTGANKSIEITGLPGGTIKATGQDAKFTYDGITVTRSSNSFKDLIDDVEIQLTATGSTTVTVGRDNDSIITKIESFVSAYNDIISIVKDNLAKPSKEGNMNPLQGDSILKDISNKLYTMFNDVFQGNSNFKMMTDIGLSIDSGVTKASDITGKITIDKTKLTEALSTNADEVIKLFSYSPPENSNEQSGIIQNIASSIRTNWTSSITGVLSVKITGYDSEIKMVDDKMSNMERSLEMKEARLKLQFSNMEIMMSSLNSQKDWLTSQFDSLTKSKS